MSVGGAKANPAGIEVTIRILDTDGRRLGRTERELARRLRECGIKARIIGIACGLEIARQGFAEACPALLVNQYTASAGMPLTPDALENFCRQLARWLTRSSPTATD